MALLPKFNILNQFSKKLVINACFYQTSMRHVMSKTVKVKQGELQGCIEHIPFYGYYASFKGIPYARPPVGELRFKAPLPPEEWIGIRDATEYGDISPQIDMITGSIIEGNENCLYLNVYSPVIKNHRDNKLPVIIFFHGGGFLSGSGNSDLYGPEYILSQNVILVTANYRLEALGFLCLYNEEVPGNAGLKDQVAVMRWVKENIENFGGDPQNITIYGESAGGVSVTYHMFSPTCKGLFQKVISHSGVCISDWALGHDSRERAFRLGRLLGNNTNEPGELVKFLRSVPAVDLVKVTAKTMTPDEKRRGIPIRFCPVIEEKSDAQEAYLTEPILSLIENGNFSHVPLILGYNSHEAINVMRDTVNKMDKINTDFERFVPIELASKISHQKSREIGEKLKKFYFGDKTFRKNTLGEMIMLQSDNIFIYNIYRFAKLMASHSSAPVHFFKFSSDSELNKMKAFLGYGDFKGTCHADDLFYIFKTAIINEDLNPETKLGQLILQIVRLWTNFSKFGHPTPETDASSSTKWIPISKLDKIEYLEIGNKLEMKEDPESERMKFWDNLYNEVQSNNNPKSRRHLRKNASHL